MDRLPSLMSRTSHLFQNPIMSHAFRGEISSETSNTTTSVMRFSEISSLLERTMNIDINPTSFTINSCLDSLNNLRTEINNTLDTENQSQEINIEQFKYSHELAIHILLLHESIYPLNPSKSTQCSVFLFNDSPSSVYCPKQQQNLPPSLISMKIDRPKSGDDKVRRDFERLLNQRERENINSSLNNSGSGVASSGVAPSETYIVNSEQVITKLNDLIEFFTFLHEMEKYSSMITRLKSMTKKEYDILSDKMTTFEKLIEMKNNIKKWEDQYDTINKAMVNLNNESVLDLNTSTYITNIDKSFKTATSEVISKLPVNRIKKELELSQGILSMCSELCKPFNGAVSIDCPVCCTECSEIWAITLCGHAVCGSCIHKLDKCPVCRVSYTDSSKLKLFISPVNSFCSAKPPPSVVAHEAFATAPMRSSLLGTFQ